MNLNQFFMTSMVIVVSTALPGASALAKESSAPLSLRLDVSTSLNGSDPMPERLDSHAFVPVDMKNGVAWTTDLNLALSKLVAELKLNNGAVVRLRSFVPDGGSLEFGIGLAEKAMQRVREELIALGVKPRRIVKDTSRDYGQRQAHGRAHGVELFLDEPDRPSRNSRPGH